jgi:hypothetical protein
MIKQNLLSLGLLLSLAPFSALAWAADGSAAYTDAKSAGPDFAIQGEYQGTVDSKPWGAQIIAMGEGKFRLVAFAGGLPGDGWKRGDETMSAEAAVVDGTISTVVKDADVKIADGTITVTEDGNTLGTLKKVQRKSPTLGQRPPENAVVLFDGTTADNFDNGELVEGDLLGATNCASKKKLGDHRLHIEFRTPFMPKARGQGRGNSGVYLQGRYECQVLDSFGLEGKNNECGGIYSISEPIVNMCLPPLSWQTYDIDFTAARYDADGKKTKNARATIKHNGVVIHDDLELTHGTPGRHPEGPEPDAIFLQNHGNPVVFRNIWVVEK